MTDDDEVILLSAFYRAEVSHIRIVRQPTLRERSSAKRCEEYLEVEGVQWRVKTLSLGLVFSTVNRDTRFTGFRAVWEPEDIVLNSRPAIREYFVLADTERLDPLIPDFEWPWRENIPTCRNHSPSCDPVSHTVIDGRVSALPATGPRGWQIRRDAVSTGAYETNFTHQTRAGFSIHRRARPPNR